MAGKLLFDPETPWQTHLRNTIAELYRTNATNTGHLMELFVRAEDAYLRHQPNLRSGTISMERLEEDYPGPPRYLVNRFTAEQRKAYRSEIVKLIPEFGSLARDVPEKGRMTLIGRCLENVLKDIDSVS
jgi:hypothetical protein